MTGDALAALLRPGNAGANTAADHITVRADSAGSAKAFLAHLRARRQHGIRTTFSVGHAVTEPVRKAIRAIPDQVWHPALEQNGTPQPAPRSPS
jgi:hypothetical protein